MQLQTQILCHWDLKPRWNIQSICKKTKSKLDDSSLTPTRRNHESPKIIKDKHWFLREPPGQHDLWPQTMVTGAAKKQEFKLHRNSSDSALQCLAGKKHLQQKDTWSQNVKRHVTRHMQTVEQNTCWGLQVFTIKEGKQCRNHPLVCRQED